ncbi:MAG: HRDC domain-containing protein [Leptospiraceae bacterium]|nr:HRDC domain-containing protein [Leptospiraceae bacterium]MBK7053783.1 HRDC domain-containing protein [Leptospiraceae bacterium]MBK9500096.1 HRDC domain-containing protein [Leptospiraceae bacterium]MBL0266304.1 HRDC domain-containing protein [Leptospiraceae bacterium]
MQINSKYILVDNKKSLELAVVNLANSKMISIDTESSGYYTYYSKVCLVQISANGKNFILDPMAQIDIKALSGVFKNPSILKIFHSAIDDIKALKRDFGFEFKNIADTMYSSKLLGLEHNSLNYLVEYYHKIFLSKTEQKSNWEKRPLDRYQLQYAALDTAYLESIWTTMRAELEKRNILDEAISEFEKMADEPYVAKEVTNEIHWHKFPNIDKFSPEERRGICDILQFRDDKAKRMNKAPFRVINNETIEKIVKKELSEDNLVTLLGKKDGAELFKILQNPTGTPLDKVDIPKLDYELKPDEESLFKQLRKWRDKIMKKRNIDHTMLLSNKNLILIIRSKINSLEELRALSLMSEWKVQNYGPSILKALKNESYDDLLNHLVPLSKVKRVKKPEQQNQKQKENKPKEAKQENKAEPVSNEKNEIVDDSEKIEDTV